MYVEDYVDHFCNQTKNNLSSLNKENKLHVNKLYFFYKKIKLAQRFTNNLYKQITASYQELDSGTRNHLFTNEKLLSSALYFSDKIKNHFMSSAVDIITYTFTINNKQINIQFIRNNESCTKGKIALYVKQIILTIYLLLDLLENNITKSLKIIIIPSGEKKEIPNEKNDILNKNQINSGLTYACVENNEILIYREEELCKVLIHEMFHAFCGDIYFDNFHFKIKNSLREIYFVNSDISLRETFSEFFANLINTMILSLKVSQKDDFNDFAYNFYILNGYEKMFSLFQSVKILNYMNLTYTDIISNKFTSLKKYREKTNVFAYHILKSLWLFYDNEFINIFMKNNSFVNKNNSNIVKNVLKLIKEKYNQPEFLKMIKVSEKKLNKIKKNKEKFESLHKSLRMTLFNIC